MNNESTQDMQGIQDMQDTQDTQGKAPSTVRHYLVCAERLLNKFDQETEGGWKDNPMLLCPWLDNFKATLSKNSWRQYKASLVHYMRVNDHEVVATALRQLSSTGCMKNTNKTSNQKAKGIKIQDLLLLDRQIIANSGKYARVTIAWLKAGVLTGLRPSEWQNAVVKDDVLVVKNGKHSNERACGEFRELDISGLSEPNKAIIIGLIKILTKDFDEVYNTCRCLLYRNCRLLWPQRKKHITLYSARHQFAANAKATNAKTEVAALMGHASQETAGTHYGRDQQGEQLVKPSQKNIDIVEQRKAQQNKNVKDEIIKT